MGKKSLIIVITPPEFVVKKYSAPLPALCQNETLMLKSHHLVFMPGLIPADSLLTQAPVTIYYWKSMEDRLALAGSHW